MLLTLRQRLLFFFCLALIGYLIAGFVAGMIIAKFGTDSTPAIRIAAVIQSMFQLIIPAIVTAMVMTRRPATLLCVDKRIDPITTLLALAALVASIPAMNFVISLNESLELPSALGGLETSLRAMEENAAKTIGALQGGTSVGDLVMNILIIGILAGFGEEIFFRGAFVRLLTTSRINRHVAIWTVAIVFSAMHLQFYGFVPRMLLGAFFGYLLLWSGSLWTPIIIHAANNIIYVCWHWAYGNEESTPIDNIGSDGDWLSVGISALITAILLAAIYRKRMKETDTVVTNDTTMP